MVHTRRSLLLTLRSRPRLRGLGLLVGFEREWSNKDIGVRSFTMTALLSVLATLLGNSLLLFAGGAVLIFIVFANLRSVQSAHTLKATTARSRHRNPFD